MLAFFDTNVAVYADDGAFPEKQRIAANLIAEHYRNGTGVVSTQVMQEYYNAATRKLRLEPELAVRRLRFFARMQVVNATPQLILEATDVHRLNRISFWDAMIVQSAKISGCNTLYSEDLNAGQSIIGVTIVNPFAGVAQWSVHESLPRTEPPGRR